jgi:ATP-dependent Lhr-like helicase
MPQLSQTVGRAFYGYFRDLREIQRGAVDPIFAGGDVLVLSPTGSGKTEAVTAPVVDKYLSAARASAGPVVVYVTPTRALANDLVRRLERPLDLLGLVAGVRHGERNDLQRATKPDVLITTPESLDVMITSQEPALLDVRAAVLDEVHLTYNTQRGLHLAVLLHRLEQFIGREVQVCALSATVATDADMWTFFRPGHAVATVRDEYARPIDAQIRGVRSLADVAVILEGLAATGKLKALVFAGSRRECDNLAAALAARPALECKVFVHHSSLNREIRLDVERRMQEASSAVCVATSTLELGIDIGDVDLVVLYGPPFGWESFVQRIGRGNRRGNKSNVLCLAAPGQGPPPFAQLLSFEALIWQVRGHRVEQRPAMNLYGAAVQQVLSLVLQGSGGYQRIEELRAAFEPWPHLGRDVIEEAIAGLVGMDVLRSHGFRNRVGAGPPLHQLRDLGIVWGNFPASSGTVTLRVSGREIGSIPVANLARVRPGVFIRFAGRRWRILQVRRDVIELQSAPGAGNEVEITYGGHRPPMDPANVEAMLLLLREGIAHPQMPSDEAETFGRAASRIGRHLPAGALPVAHDSGRFLYFTFAGRTLNEVIAIHSGTTGYRANEVVLESVDEIDFGSLPADVATLLPSALPLLSVPGGLTIFQQLLPTSLLERELAELWLKSPVYARSLLRLRTSEETPVLLQDIQEIAF